MSRRLHLAYQVALIVGGAMATSPTALSQAPQIEIVTAYVDPIGGFDDPFTDQVNDPAKPLKTLQGGIDEVYSFLHANSSSSSTTQGLVYCLPGLYGPHGTGSSGDVFPIIMRDRVHVRGLGTRRCIIRGNGTKGTDYYWPTEVSSGGAVDGEVLVHYAISTDCDDGPAPLGEPPWIGTGDTAEMFDGFTFQGGDVQVLIGDNSSGFGGLIASFKATISNCLFDMRHDWKPDGVTPLDGPYFGIQMWKGFNRETTFPGYYDHEVLIANNTFIFAEWKGPDSGDWYDDEAARRESVGIIDVADPGCSFTFTDLDTNHRGLGSPAIINNLFRTMPRSGFPKPFAMLGVDYGDTTIDDAGGPINTNIFASNRVGEQNGDGVVNQPGFWSRPVTPVVNFQFTPCTGRTDDVYDCRTNPSDGGNCNNPPVTPCDMAAFPVPVLALVDGPPGPQWIDPGFVGEWLSTVSFFQVDRYMDWRLLPESPAANLGAFIAPGAGGAITMVNGKVYTESTAEELRVFRWDGESYGNPRVVDDYPDVGFDETHDFFMTGSWANNSNSHNRESFLNPVGTGTDDRFMVFRDNIAGGTFVTVFGSQQVAANQTPPPYPSAWSQPPSTLANPITHAPFPDADRRTRYIGVSNGGGAPTPWPDTEIGVTPQLMTWSPRPNSDMNYTQPVIRMGLHLETDDDINGNAMWFNCQAVIHDDSGIGMKWYDQMNTPPYHNWKSLSNLQSEYR